MADRQIAWFVIGALLIGAFMLPLREHDWRDMLIAVILIWRAAKIHAELQMQ